ncbi:conjugal transfer protein [Oceanobacillus oncorhynchi subsp. oncorhynchi]|uniref:conjugal transfer protein n=1 Tax=Oceanobacillus oncorhynchi TaxID=545501 RepID=UPI0031CFFEB9
MGLKEKFRKSKVVGKVKQVHRPKKEKSSVRKDNSKRTAFFVWTLILGMLFIATLAILLSVNTRSTLNETNRNLLAMEDEEVLEEISQEQANEFLSSFIRVYMNVPKDSDARTERASNLQEYMVFNDVFNNDNNEMYRPEGEGTRNLESFTLFNIEENESSTIYQYKVTFTNKLETEGETGKGKDKKTETEVEEEQQTLLLNIPLVVEDGLFSITSVPYFTSVPSLAGNIEYETESIDLEEYNGNEKENIMIFLNNFFEKYTTETVEEMSYLMEEPETLNGSFLFEEIQDVVIYQDDNSYKVLLKVNFKDEISGIHQVNDVEMNISKDGSNFYVDEFKYK